MNLQSAVSQNLCILCGTCTKEGLRYVIHSKAEGDYNKATCQFQRLPNELKNIFKFDRGNFLCKTCLKVLEKREKLICNLKAENNKLLSYCSGDVNDCHIQKRGLVNTEDSDEPARKFVGLNSEKGFHPAHTSTPVKYPVLERVQTTTTACASPKRSQHFAKETRSSETQDLGVKVS